MAIITHFLMHVSVGNRAIIMRTPNQAMLGKKVKVVESHGAACWRVRAVGNWTFPDGGKFAVCDDICLKKVLF